MERQFKGVWIPAVIWLSEDLTIQEKCLIVEIDSLDNSERGCFASNLHLSKFIGLSEGRTANIITSLKKKEFIKQIYFDGRNRGLRVCIELDKSESSIPENVKADSMDSLKLPLSIREHSNTDSKPLSNILTWRNDFETYKNELREAHMKLIHDKEWIKKQEKFHPNLDIKLSLEKATVNFWATEDGWNYKKRKKSKTCNWNSTLTNAIDLNKVYKQREKTY